MGITEYHANVDCTTNVPKITQNTLKQTVIDLCKCAYKPNKIKQLELN